MTILLTLFAVLASSICTAKLIVGASLKRLSKNIRPKYLGYHWGLLLASFAVILWTWVASGDLSIFVFNLRGVLAGVITGFLLSRSRRELSFQELEEKLWRNTIFYALLHG